jgi:predicted nucleotidyltransferase
LADTKEFLKKELNKEVDFVDKDTLNEIEKEVILKELKYL